MSKTRLVLRATVIAGVAAAGISASATPAAAFCLGHGCGGFGLHFGPAHPAFIRRAAPPRVVSVARIQRTTHVKPSRPKPAPAPVADSSHRVHPRFHATPPAAPVSPHGPVGAGGVGPTRLGLDGGASGQGSPSFVPASVNESSSSRPAQPETLGSGGPPRRTLNDPATSNERSKPVLTAVPACVTRVGSCAMQRDIGTACQCMDQQGNTYDGIVK